MFMQRKSAERIRRCLRRWVTETVCLTLATPENIEVVGDAGIPYIDEFDLAEKLQRVLRDGSLVQCLSESRATASAEITTTGNTLLTSMRSLFRKMSGSLADDPERQDLSGQGRPRLGEAWD